MQLSIIIVNYNVKYFVEHCLLSVIKACENLQAEIIVVDNNSTDGSEQYLSSKFTNIKFIWNKENAGFGKANNQALKIATGDYILFLNPDTIVPENCFTNCIDFFKNNNDCGALGVRMIDGAGHFLKESKRSTPTAAAGFFKMIGLASLLPNSRFFAKYYASFLEEKENNKVDILAGAFMMLSKKAIDITNGFDESYFMYGEDIDLSYRIQKAGLQNYYLGSNTIIHFKGESTQKKSNSYTTHFYGAIQLFVNKHYGKYALKAILMKAVIIAGKYFAMIKQFLSKSIANKKVLPKQHCLFIGDKIGAEKATEILAQSTNQITENSMSFTLPISNDIDAVIFNSNNFSYVQIIEMLEKISNKKIALFYASKASSIIGSNDKNERGIFISAQ